MMSPERKRAIEHQIVSAQENDRLAKLFDASAPRHRAEAAKRRQVAVLLSEMTEEEFGSLTTQEIEDMVADPERFAQFARKRERRAR